MIKTEIDIDAPPAAVWDVLLKWEDYPSWNPFVLKISGTPEVGSKLKVTLKPAGKSPTDLSPSVLKLEDKKVFAWRGTVPLLLTAEHYFEVEEKGPNSTRFVHWEVFGGLLARLFSRMMGDSATQAFLDMNQALKKRVEGGPASAAASS